MTDDTILDAIPDDPPAAAGTIGALPAPVAVRAIRFVGRMRSSRRGRGFLMAARIGGNIARSGSGCRGLLRGITANQVAIGGLGYMGRRRLPGIDINLAVGGPDIDQILALGHDII